MAVTGAAGTGHSRTVGPVDVGAPVAVPAGDGAADRPGRDRACGATSPSPAGSPSPPVLGSRSTDTLSGLGPPPLRAGDRAAARRRRAARPAAGGRRPAAPRRPAGAAPDAAARARATTGSPPTALRRCCCGSAYTVSPVRATGSARGWPARRCPARSPANCPARASCSARCRCRPDGQPLIFLADHPTTGGYPVIGVVDRRRPAAARAGPARHYRSRVSMDLNADLGEGFGIWRLGDDEALLDLVTSANVACGFHAGDAVHHAPGLRRAPPSAGSRSAPRSATGTWPASAGGASTYDLAELRDEMIYQLGALDAFCRLFGDPGPLRQAARRALQRGGRRRVPGRGGRRRRRRLRPRAAGALPARLGARPARGRRRAAGGRRGLRRPRLPARRHAGAARHPGRGPHRPGRRWPHGRSGWPPSARWWRSTAPSCPARSSRSACTATPRARSPPPSWSAPP